MSPMEQTVPHPAATAASATTLAAVAARVVALALVPVLLVAGCSGSDATGDAADSGDQSQSTASSSTSTSASQEGGRFASLPEPCSLIGEGTIDEVVPKADPKKGETLTSSDTSTSRACLWSGLKGYQFRSLTLSLRRFESDASMGSGDERAAGYQARLVEEITTDTANKDISSDALTDTGDSSTSIGYQVTKTADGEKERYIQQRVVVRVANVVLSVDYSGAAFEGVDTPSAGGIKQAAETAAREATAALDE